MIQVISLITPLYDALFLSLRIYSIVLMIGIALQAMDNSHVALVSMLLRAEGFDPYRCDRNVALGINLNSFAKVLRSAQNDDIITIKADDTPDTLNLVFESAKQERMSEYDIKLMDIDSEHMGIPDVLFSFLSNLIVD